jgi:two-component system, chemotaxis family, CheB/CheR fusion protein
VSPYSTLENRIDGVVITFSNITEAKTVEAQLWQTQSEMEKRVKKDPP